MSDIPSYRGFTIEMDEDVFSVKYADKWVGSAHSVEDAHSKIDFCWSGFHVMKTHEEERNMELDAAEPVLSQDTRVAWVKWYRERHGCGLREAHNEALSRLAVKKNNATL